MIEEDKIYFARTPYGQEEIADMFGVTNYTISDIKREKTWICA